MNKLLSIILLLLFCLSAPLSATESIPDTKEHSTCEYCGMNRTKFAHSRMLIEYTDGSSVATCSIHCAAIEFALRIDKTPKAILVGDYDSKQLIDAETATWVLGGKKKGVMTKRAKWAFSSKSAAERFVHENSGVYLNFDQAMKSSFEDMYMDTQAIRKKRKAKMLEKQQNG